MKANLKRTTRLRITWTAVTSVLTPACKMRGGPKTQLAMLRTVQAKALRFAFGVTTWDMAGHGIKQAQLEEAAGWLRVDVMIKRQFLQWLGHVARMPKDRMPKIALFGWRPSVTVKPRHWKNQIEFARDVMKEAKIPEIDWFKAAQSRGKTGRWQRAIDRAFPKPTLSKEHREELDAWRLGPDCAERLPKPKRRRLTRGPYMQTGQLMTQRGWFDQTENACPRCEFVGSQEQPLHRHYEKEHAVLDPEITTIPEIKCTACGQHF